MRAGRLAEADSLFRASADGLWRAAPFTAEDSARLAEIYARAAEASYYLGDSVIAAPGDTIGAHSLYRLGRSMLPALRDTTRWAELLMMQAGTAPDPAEALRLYGEAEDLALRAGLLGHLDRILRSKREIAAWIDSTGYRLPGRTGPAVAPPPGLLPYFAYALWTLLLGFVGGYAYRRRARLGRHRTNGRAAEALRPRGAPPAP